MSKAVRRCYLGWKCDAKYVRGGIHNSESTLLTGSACCIAKTTDFYGRCLTKVALRIALRGHFDTRKQNTSFSSPFAPLP